MSATNKTNHVQGVIFDSSEPDTLRPVIDATLTNTRFVCDFREEDKDADIHIEADSSDGITYSGRWGWPLLDDDRNTTELTRFDSKHKEIVLLGKWMRDDNEEGMWLFRLRKSQAPKRLSK
jgi:hypothetical protein